MKKTLLFVCLVVYLLPREVRGDEGMWLPILMGSKHYEAMQAKGYRLTPEDLYSVNQASLKDAIVLFGRGCTGELVSSQGLMLTNHHCGYSRIQAHSSVANDYLTHGFWAASREEELPNEGLTASVLVRMEDVTDGVTAVLRDDMTETERNNAIRSVSIGIVAAATAGTHYTAEVVPFYHGNQFILMIMEVFRDVRLVGAPPSAIGKFGGDTDNWMWPRHTGDFAIFRIYANKENKPAPYSKDNIPYSPRKFLEISLKGVQEGDFTMVYGFPAQTESYLPSYAIDLYQHHQYPAIVKVRDHELAIINRTMASSDALRIMYAGRQASVANGWKKFIGVIPGLERYKVLEKKQQAEIDMIAQLAGDPILQQQYRQVMESYRDAYGTLLPLSNWNTWFTECFWKQPFFRFVFRGYWMTDMDPASVSGAEAMKKTVGEINQSLPGMYGSVDLAAEKAIFAEMLRLFVENVPESGLAKSLTVLQKKSGWSYEKYTESLFSKSLYHSEQAASEFFRSWDNNRSMKKLLKDPLFLFMKDIVDEYRKDYQPAMAVVNRTIDSLHRVHMRILLEQNEPGSLYPNANSTLRISYGQVQGSFPRDAVRYHFQTTLDGILMKESDEIEDYFVPKRLKEIASPEYYAPYGTGNTMPVAFIASNHTTGGNSGSPVLNAEGHLIGINFDRAWEGTMSDLNFEPEICRNISIDIRYLLFVVEQYAGAAHLTSEMVIHR